MPDVKGDAQCGSPENAIPPLKGVRVLDLGQIYNGPYAGLLLALAGADVVKVEPPGGESLRNRPKVNGAEYPFLALNASKRMIALDLKDSDDRGIFMSLAKRADVVLENYAPGVMNRLGLDYESLRSVNPRLIYASSSGYGEDGAYADLLAMDLTVQAMSGVMDATGFAENPPVKAGAALCDFFGGIHLYGGIVTALVKRERTGCGSRVEVSMMDAVIPSLLSNLAPVMMGIDMGVSRTGNHHGGLAECPYNVYRVRDGYVAIICVSERHWQDLVKCMAREELLEDPNYVTKAARVERMEEVDALVEEWTSKLRRDEVMRRLRQSGVPVAPVRTLAEVASDQVLLERGSLQDVEHPGRGRVRLINSPIRYGSGVVSKMKAAGAIDQDRLEIIQEWLGIDGEDAGWGR